MIEYLNSLLESKEWEKALKLADQLLISASSDPQDLLKLSLALTQCRFGLSEFYGAVTSARMAQKISLEIQDWDRYGEACFHLYVASERLGLYQQANDAIYDFLSKLPMYRTVRTHEGLAWFNLGVSYTKMGQSSEAVKVLKRALEASNWMPADNVSHAIRHALISALLETREFTAVPALLAKCLKYIHSLTDSEGTTTTRLWHFHLRAEFALRTGRLARAAALARRGLREAQGQPRHQYNLVMALAHVHYRRGQMSEALAHILSARVLAIQGKRFDLEYKAALLMYELASNHPGAFEELHLTPEHVNFSGFPIETAVPATSS